MSKYYYFKNGRISIFNFELIEGYYNVGHTYLDYLKGKYVLLSLKLIEFMSENPSASIIEIWNTELNISQTEPSSLAEMKNLKKDELHRYWYSDVEQFVLNGEKVWINQLDRMNYMYIINIKENYGKVLIDIDILGNKYKMTTEKAKEIISEIELYNLDCNEIMNTKLLEIETSNDLEFIKNYNVKEGFPENLQFILS